MTAAAGKVVFDTNILISAHFWKGPPYRCLLAAEARLVVLVLSDPIVSELREKLTAKFALSAAEVEAIVNHLSSHAEHVQGQGRSGWVPQDATTTSSLTQHCQAERQSSCLETVTCSRWGPSKASKS